jgi:hypothetical protein
MSNVRWIGLDVHAETIAVADPEGDVRSLGVIPNRPESIRRLIKKLGSVDQLRVCYEASPTGVAPVRSRRFQISTATGTSPHRALKGLSPNE